MTTKDTFLNSRGQKYGDFEVTKAIEIPELQCFLRELIHHRSQAQIIHIANDDPENMFCLSFQTRPNSSNGVAHILEHTVLCGSKKFPIKDPFFAMNRRSLNTFMNALTGSDFTCYPAASQIPKDFYNLLEVYLDAVFEPNLKELSFLQEGHRIEFASSSDPSTPLEYKGVVFNEMKGALASGNARLGEAVNRFLFPDLTYGYNSGGDPKVIPLLTYSELKEFHQTFYHPSRCLFFFYGNMPLKEHLDFIADQTLNRVKPVPPLPPVPLQPRFEAPRNHSLSYPLSPDEDIEEKAFVSFAWLTCSVLEQEELLALSILEIFLMDTDASPLKMAFMKSGLCKQAGAYIEGDISEIPFVIVLKGCKPEDAESLEKVLNDTLKEILHRGIPLDKVENAMHQLEFYRSEITGDQAPFGLSLFMRSALLRQHGANAEDGLTIHSLFEKIRQHILQDPEYLLKILRKHFIDNTHFIKIVMTPDPELASKEHAEEKAILDKVRASLSEQQVAGLIAKARELAAFQKSQEDEDLDVLPKVTLEDVPQYSRNYELHEEMAGNIKVFRHTCFTNSITYADLVFHIPDLPEEDLPYLRLLTSLMSQMGCGDRDYVQNLDYIQAHTGGVSVGLNFNMQAADSDLFYPSLSIRGKALNRKNDKLFPLIHQMATSTDVTNIPRLKEVIIKYYTGLQSSLQQSGLRYAINLSASGLNVSGKIANAWYGLEYYWMIQDLAENFDERAQQLVEKFEELKDKVLCTDDAHLVITSDAEAYDSLKGHHFYGLSSIKTHPFSPWKGLYSTQPVQTQCRLIASPIAFIAKTFKSVPYTHKHSPALNAAAFIFDNLTLHPSIREQGGAYGGGASNNSMSGYFYFYSYRDPHIARSLNVFEEAVREVVQGNFDDSDLEEAKLEMIQALDAPIAPGSRGDLAYGWLREGKTHAVRQAYRNKLLALTKEDIIEAVKQEILTHMPDGITVVFAGKELADKENIALINDGKAPLPLEKI